MAKSIQNVVMKGASGKIGKMIVFRQAPNGDTIIADLKKKSKKPLHPNQKEVIRKFKIAAYMAKIYAKDPILRPQYEEKGKKLKMTAYNMAMQDCLNAPIVEAVILKYYNGTVGSVLQINAVDDFSVVSVAVRILSANDTLIEQGEATFEEGGLNWIYVATATNATLSGTKVEVTATDIPGNQTVHVETIV